MTLFFWILGIFILLAGVARYISVKMYDLKLTTHEATPEKFKIAFDEIRIPTRNKKSLYGWWIPSASDPSQAPTLILVHGWSRNLGRMLRYVQHLHPLGYNLIAFDARHHGSSDQDDHASMYKFGQDIQAAFHYLCRQDIDTKRIGVIGLSIGGAGSVYAAALEPGIKAVVTVGAPAHPVDIMAREFARHRVPRFLTWLALKQVEFKIGAKYDIFAPVNNISKAQARFLIIHGTEDEVVIPSQGDKLFDASRPGQSQIWRITGKAHSNCHHEAGFWDRVHTFFKQQLT